MELDSSVEMFNDAPKQALKFPIIQAMMTPLLRLTFGKRKFSDIVSMKRPLKTRLYNLSQNAKFADSSTLSQNVINYLVKCFSNCVAQNKGNAKAIQSNTSALFPVSYKTFPNYFLVDFQFRSSGLGQSVLSIMV